MKLVTRESLQRLIDDANKAKSIAIVGRALVHLLKRQTQAEQSDNNTTDHNGIGFTGTDGRCGSLTAKYFIRHNTLLDWQLDKWTRKNTKGYSRITKYHKQLNEVATGGSR